MIYKYFAYKEGQYWRINDLLSMDQCRAQLSALAWKKEVFASIQNYDEYGNVLSGPIWFDLDGDPANVLADAKDLVCALEFLVNCTPRIYFSGRKGFHLIIERQIEHPRVHEIVADFAQETAGTIKTLDKAVYRTRSMFRIPGSPASEKGYYKIELTRGELFTLSFEEIRQLASKQRFIETEHDPSKMDDEQIVAWLKIAEAKLPVFSTVTDIERARNLELEFTPCLRHLLTQPAPPGERNLTAFLLARFFKVTGLDRDSAERLFFSQQHWKSFELEGREVSKVLKSVYQSRQEPRVGCKTPSPGADLMRSYCDQLCHFRDDFPQKMFTT